MSGHAKARAWAIAGLVPAILVATWITGRNVPDAGALLIMAALGWGWVCAVLAEHSWQTPTVKWLEHRNLILEEQLAAAEALLKAQADTVVIDIRANRPHQPAPSSDLARRVEAARDRERLNLEALHAEPSPAELDQAKADMVAAFEPYDTWGDAR